MAIPDSLIERIRMTEEAREEGTDRVSWNWRYQKHRHLLLWDRKEGV